MNSLAIGGILYEIGYFDEDELDISTIVTAKLVIKFKNLGENDTLTFESITTSESTAYILFCFRLIGVSRKNATKD